MHVFVDKIKVLEQKIALSLIRLPLQYPKKIIEQLHQG